MEEKMKQSKMKEATDFDSKIVKEEKKTRKRVGDEIWKQMVKVCKE